MNVLLWECNFNAGRSKSFVDLGMQFRDRADTVFEVGKVGAEHEVQRAIGKLFEAGRRSWIREIGIQRRGAE